MLGPLGICIHHQIDTFVDTVSNLQHECYELDIQAPTVSLYIVPWNPLTAPVTTLQTSPGISMELS